jgi:hypothetical protein
MCTARLPVVDWTDAPADLNGLARFVERRNLVSARVPSHFQRSLPILVQLLVLIISECNIDVFYPEGSVACNCGYNLQLGQNINVNTAQNAVSGTPKLRDIEQPAVCMCPAHGNQHTWIWSQKLGRQPVGLQPLACWGCGFESHRGHGCLSVLWVLCVFR